MNINFELYKVFYYVAKNLSFSDAANQLYITQSAVSQSIKLLEEKLNSKLFFRHTKLVKLTPEGELLYKHIEQAFNFIKTGERNLHQIHSLKQGEVRIGASDTICKYTLLPYFKKFHHLYPHIKIKVINRPSPVCVELLRKGTVDLSVVNLSPGNRYENLDIKEIKEIHDVFIGGIKFQHLRGNQLSIRDLKDYPLLILEKNSTTREFFEEFIKRYDIEMIPEIELGSMDLLISLTKIGLGISFVMEDAIKDELLKDEVFVIDLIEDLPKRSIGAVTNGKIPVPLAAQKFMDLFNE